ncbi:hypothetical protein CLAFUW4_02304 [Fulvia fulva]|uniref:DUF1748-domain-containing protein n=1 Tax=Passalora fulva TaxID=5499 RepID=A0A9Q8P314_PASFU|nr:uncharacterized protein CLAFUR5_02293 [Fulvia fulva]KAK4635258.1 hypothetical protein CLAFUR4_02299 [Fulvia fulva]KAK4637023.1 hypothetical protein CLAFUR0_02303 [Fulvia fulva]UJO11458.1 hypothetical protein CLAFUR5_02293 [Fulvia fulva]WPV10186.1 hypothetical protein CLAFUW4_02304 [Fulvia fulva]WPV23135.1 hypothetical protein CLAFUW7_02304 [Fulvia fulva]
MVSVTCRRASVHAPTSMFIASSIATISITRTTSHTSVACSIPVPSTSPRSIISIWPSLTSARSRHTRRTAPQPQAAMVLGRLAHYTFDAVLVSAFLAGVKRSTGLTPSLKPDTFSESPSIKKWIENYLWVGETIMDQSVAVMSSSGYFERKR